MIKIVLADSLTLFRQGLCMMINAETDMKVVGEAADANEAVDLAGGLGPDLVLIGVGMSGLGVFEAIRQIKKTHPNTKILLLGPCFDEDHLVEGIVAGVNGYFLGGDPFDQLALAIRSVCGGGGGRFFTPQMMNFLVDRIRGGSVSASLLPRFDTLTSREREVLKLLAEGNLVKEIAYELNLSTRTVDAHKSNLMGKLNIHDRVKLALYAIKKGVIKVPIDHLIP